MRILNKRKRAIAIFLLFTFTLELLLPLKTYALTGGPSQPEVQSFEPVGTTDMVDLFSGDFNYNIPLLDVEGYPINIAYHSGISMDQEASWVGLGWNINPGVINRNMRGLPDDFKGDEIYQKYDTKRHDTRGLNAGVAFELFGKELKSKLKDTPNSKTTKNLQTQLGINLGIKYDNYRGMGCSIGLSPNASISETTTENVDITQEKENGDYILESKSKTTSRNIGLDLNFDSYDGFSSSASYSKSITNARTFDNLSQYSSTTSSTTSGISAGLGFNSRSGFSGLTLGKSSTGSSSTFANGKKTSRNIDRGSENGGTFLTQNHPSYQPNAKTQLNSLSFNLNFKIGSEVLAVFPDMNLGGYLTYQKYKPERILNGYGSLFNHLKPGSNFLQDFNRYNEGSYSKFTQNLPMSVVTSDYFAVSGQGIGGSFKLKQSYTPVVYDDEVYSNSTNVGLGGELGIPSILKLGINANVVFTSNRSGVKKLNDRESKFLDYSTSILPVDFEQSYFKSVGEKTPVDATYYTLMQKEKVIKPSDFYESSRIIEMLKTKYNYVLGDFDISKLSTIPSYMQHDIIAILSEKATKREREKRNQAMQYLTVEQIQNVPVLALEKNIKSYVLNNLDYLWSTSATEVSRSVIQQQHHISEVTVLADDGRRYVYGIPAMNNIQKEYTFSLSATPTVSNQIATYSLGASDSIDYQKSNSKINWMYNEQDMPKYAHSFLLSGILSDDYIDRTNNGITDDDYGTAVKFNYTKADAVYHWRTPYNTRSANYQEGSKSNPSDNKGSFVYGEKEVWYMHSIETKNFVAVFIMSARADGLGVTGRDGGKNAADTLKKLDRIVLYSKSDLLRNHNNAIPIKTVHFEYDYTLCKNVENNSGETITVNGVNINANKGKLTLKKIYFTYGNSNKGMYTSYRFSYSDPNPDYNIKGYDRWGNYAAYRPDATDAPNNAEWPFTNQSKTNADSCASAWNLNKIELPTGGIIKVTYESDDYAYVQEKQAQMMLNMVDIGKTSSDYTPGKLKATLYNGKNDNNNYIFFKIPTTSGSIAISDYFKGVESMYFNIRSIIRERSTPEEDINGFCEIVKDANNEPDCGVVASHTDIGWVHVKEVSIKDDDDKKTKQQIQPMAKQAFIYAIQNTPEQVYPGSNPNATGESAIKGMLTSFGEIVSLVKSCYKIMRDKEYCKSVILGKSYIRVNCASKFKMGGGTRVKKIELDDKWADMKNSPNSNAQSSSYGQEYSYTTTEGTQTISSGVAQWEPTIGGDENSYRLPIWEIEKRYAGRDVKTLHMEPVAEALYPSPNVGYSKVTVKSLGGKTGRTETIFYTAKDFPTQVIKTNIDKNTSDNPYFQNGSTLANMAIKKGANAANKALKKTGFGFGLDVNYNYLKVQQGYTIINNDMHGKLREQHIYPEGSNTPRSSVKYNYKVDPLDHKKLDNKVLTYDSKTNLVKEEVVGVDFELSYDKQAEQTITGSARLQFNNDNFMVTPLPVASLTFFLGLGFNLNDFKYAVITKQVNQYAILESTEVFEDGSTINTKNLLYDAQTGETLLTETLNEFNDKIYNLSYPAHFAYDGMSQAYKNLNISLEVKSTVNGALQFNNAADNWKINTYLVPGDELSVNDGSANYKAWVYQMRNNAYCLINEDGNIIKDEPKLEIQVIRSGRRNMQNIPIGGLTLLTNPLVKTSGVWSLVIDPTNVLNTSAQTFAEDWQTFCANDIRTNCEKETEAGRGIKLWLDKITKKHLMTDSMTYASDTTLPEIFKNIKFCDTTYAGTHYTVNTSAVESAGHISYVVKNSSNAACCPIALGSNYTNCRTIPVTKYVIMFPSNHQVYTWHGTKHQIDDLEPYNIFNHQSSNDSIVTGDTCALVNDTLKCHSMTHIYRIAFVSKDMYDSLAHSQASDSSDVLNYLYKRKFDFDSIACEYLRYDSINSTSVYPISVDTSTFQIDNGSKQSFKILATLNNGKKIWITGSLECPVDLFKDCCQDCLPPDNKIINPYTNAIKGIWRKKADYAFHAKRTISTNPKIRKDGVFDEYYPFWSYSSGAKNYVKATGTNWQKANEVTMYNPYGNEIENKDALGIYSSAIYAYNYRLPVAVAKNTKYTQLAYDGFEDYGMFAVMGTCPESHWSFEWSRTTSTLDYSLAHSGKVSLKVPANHSEMVARKVVNCKNANTGVETDEYVLQACNCIKKFSPDTGDYVIGGWIREGHGAMQAVTDSYNVANITVKLKKSCNDTTPIIYVFHSDGLVIEEWQRLEKKFNVPEGYSIVEIYLNAPNYDAWFDDLRIHPFLGNMKSYSYDQISLRLMAELDENNFATFYEYDQEGQLMRVKKETVNGIVTLKEIRSHSSNRQ